MWGLGVLWLMCYLIFLGHWSWKIQHCVPICSGSFWPQHKSHNRVSALLQVKYNIKDKQIINKRVRLHNMVKIFILTFLHHSFTIKTIIYWGMYQTNMFFLFIFFTSGVGQYISTTTQHCIIILFLHIFYFSQKIAASCTVPYCVFDWIAINCTVLQEIIFFQLQLPLLHTCL